MERPRLMMPEAEAEYLRATYEKSSVILEYGMGGSTVIAGEMPGKTVLSVESDPDWYKMMHRWFQQNPARATLRLHYGDIGPTGKWGAPAHQRWFRRWQNYPLTVWDRKDFVQPDTILVDGRFRVACLLTAAFRITRPVVLLFDDYKDREPYHHVEEMFQPTEIIGRMARFDLTPQPFPVDRMGWIMKFYTRSA